MRAQLNRRASRKIKECGDRISPICAPTSTRSNQTIKQKKKITECGDKLEAGGEETAGDRWPAAKN